MGERARAGPAQLERPIVPGHRERPEQRDLHPLTLPWRSCQGTTVGLPPDAAPWRPRRQQHALPDKPAVGFILSGHTLDATMVAIFER
jgi:hypothetical protein